MILMTVLVASTGASAQKTELVVSEVVFCTGVEDRQPVGANSQFFDTMERIYCFTRITGAAEDVKIYHVWIFGEEEKARVELTLRSSNWRTWSSKRIIQAWSGAWRVDIVLENGDIIASREFVYKPVNE